MEQNPTTPWGLSRLDSYAPTGELPEVATELDPMSQTTRYRDAANQPMAIDEQCAGRCAAPPTTRSGADSDVSYAGDATDEAHRDDAPDGDEEGGGCH
ncbi:putative ATP-grasp-modified RiPP [Streptomyces piniterrae]|nr:putative ATP-grasp-modified RiPP [Streptomyces piniterrae]